MANADVAIVSNPASAQAQEPRQVDLAITNTASVRHAKVGQFVTFTSVATNNGPDEFMFFYVNVGEGEGLVNLGFGSVACAGVSNDGNSCEYGFLFRPGDVVTQTFNAIVLPDGKWARDTACVFPFQELDDPRVDPNPANNCATARVRVVGKR